MLKLAIVAMASISYCLFLSNITQAKQPTVNKRLNQNLSCESQTNTVAKSNVISTADIRAICTILVDKYRESNQRGINKEYKPGYNNGDDELIAWEVEKLSIVPTSHNPADYAEIEVQYIRRTYQYKSNIWNMKGENAESEIVVFRKKDAKWNYSPTIRSGLMGL